VRASHPTEVRRRLKREVVQRQPASSLRVEDDVRPHIEFLWHHHPEVELTLSFASGLRYVGDSVLPFRSGDLTLIGPGLPHSWISDPECGTCRVVVVKFPAELIADAHLPDVVGLRPLLQESYQGLAIGGPGRQEVERIMLQLAQVESPVVRLARLLEILAIIQAEPQRSTLSAVSARSEHISPEMARVMDRISDPQGEPLEPGEAAEIAGMTSASFSRAFKRQFGKTFVSYLAEMRVGWACVDLAETERKIIDIAIGCGFGDLTTFNRWFFRITGVQPSKYRRMSRASTAQEDRNPLPVFT
jgi:AraC-like DNA-binding protein